MELCAGQSGVRRLIKVDDSIIELPDRVSMETIKALLGAEVLDDFTLRDGLHVCFVDDEGHCKDLPVNMTATQLYWEKCGGQRQHTIVGNVVIVPESDYSG